MQELMCNIVTKIGNDFPILNDDNMRSSIKIFVFDLWYLWIERHRPSDEVNPADHRAQDVQGLGLADRDSEVGLDNTGKNTDEWKTNERHLSHKNISFHRKKNVRQNK